MKYTAFQSLADSAACGICTDEDLDNWKIKIAELAPGWMRGRWQLQEEVDPAVLKNGKRQRRGKFLCTWCGDTTKEEALLVAMTPRMGEWCQKCNGRLAHERNKYGPVVEGDRIGQWEVIELAGDLRGTASNLKAIVKCHGGVCDGGYEERIIYGLQQKLEADGDAKCFLCSTHERHDVRVRVDEKSGKQFRECHHCRLWLEEDLRHWPEKNGKAMGNRCQKCISKRAHARRMSDPVLHITANLRSRVSGVLRRMRAGKSVPTMSYLGCDGPTFIAYLEDQFAPGMTWDNYGPKGPSSTDGYWEVDHKRPIAFMLNGLEPDSEDFERALRDGFHFTNCQPMWMRENREKNSIHLGRRYYYSRD